jgi:hypothetical protein
MTVHLSGPSLRTAMLGARVEKSTGTLTAATLPLFTISGLVAITTLVGKVTTAITVANAYWIQLNPTVGATIALVTALDIGTTDTPVGEILVVEGDGTALALGSRAVVTAPIICSTGQIEHVSAGTDGAILWALTYVPLEDDATVVAA